MCCQKPTCTIANYSLEKADMPPNKTQLPDSTPASPPSLSTPIIDVFFFGSFAYSLSLWQRHCCLVIAPLCVQYRFFVFLDLAVFSVLWGSKFRMFFADFDLETAMKNKLWSVGNISPAGGRRFFFVFLFLSLILLYVLVWRLCFWVDDRVQRVVPYWCGK